MQAKSMIPTAAALVATQPCCGRPVSTGFHPAGVGCDEILSKQELAERLKVSLRTVERWQREGHLPFLKISNVVLFYWPAVLEHLLANFHFAPGGTLKPFAKSE